MRRILCFIDNLGAGGAQRQMIYMASALKEAGYAVKIITYQDVPFYIKDIKVSGLEYECVAKANKHLTRILYINKSIKQYSPDLVIAYLDTPCIVACVCRLLQRNKWKLIVSERNTTQIITLRERIKFFLYKLADKIVPNAFAQEVFINQHFSTCSKKTQVIVNMVDLERFCPAKVKSHNEILQIVVAASIWPSKNTKGCIEAVKRIVDMGITNFHISWFGLSEYEYCSESIKLVEKLNLQQWISLLPKTKNIEEEYRKADWFCLPSFYEGTPNVICEAMATGLPILCSDICDNGYYVSDKLNGYLFDPKNINSISESLIKAISANETERIKMGKESRNIAEDKLSYSVFSENYIQLVKSLIN